MQGTVVGSSGPSSSTVGRGVNTAGSGRTPTSGGEEFDYRSAFTSAARKLETTERNLVSLRRDLDAGKADRELIGRMREVFNPESARPVTADPVVDWEVQLDHYLERAIENKNQGGDGLPLTTNLAVNLFKNSIAFHSEIQALKTTVAELQGQLALALNPSHAVNQQAFAQFDTYVKNGIEKIYGTNPNTESTRGALFRAVGQLVAPAVNALMKNDPQRWEMMRRDPQELQNMANRALRKVLPPKVIQMIESEALKNTPMTKAELREAFQQTEAIKDPVERQRIREKIRQDLLEQQVYGGSSRRG